MRTSTLKIAPSAAAIAVLSLTIAAACGGGGAEPTPTVSPEAPSTPAPTFGPPTTPEAPNARFVPAEPPFFTGEESDDPFAGELPGPTGWRVYLVRGEGRPELIYETKRWLQDLQWSPDGRTVMARFRSAAAGGLSYLRGMMFFDVSSPTVATSELLMEHTRLIYPSPDGSQLAFEVVPDDSSAARDVYVADRDKHAQKLEGLGEKARLIGWLPDGSGLLVYTVTGPTISHGLLYLVPLAGGPATLVNQEASYHYQVAWSPEGTRLAYVSGGDLHVFDRASGQSRQVTFGTGYQFAVPKWSADGSEVILGGDLIDLATGDVVASLVPPGQVIDSTLSPDGRYFVATEPCEGYPPPHRIHLYDKKTGETRLLRDCDEAVSAHLRWLPDGHHLLVKEPSCYGCETVTFSITSMDVESGDVVALTDGLEPHAAACASPDGGRVLVTGKALRLYTQDGQLLRVLPAPEGFDVAAAAWSPDGSIFAYVIGPAGFFLL